MIQYELLVLVALRGFHRDSLGDFRRYSFVVDSVGVVFVRYLFMGKFYGFRSRRSFYVHNSLFLILFCVLSLTG